MRLAVKRFDVADLDDHGRSGCFGGTAYDVKITDFDRTSRLVFEASGKPELTIACTLTPTDEVTELESDFGIRPTGALKVLFPLLAPVIRRDVPKQYASLKALCER